jgi:regulatory protein
MARPPPARKAGKPVARPITAKYLQNAAMFYLERYSASAEGVRRVLQRRINKARRLEAPVMDDVESAIEATIQKLIDIGLIDDRQFAQTKARALHRRGTSARFTRQKLQVAGVDPDTVQCALEALGGELGADAGQREWQAAVALARRRRLGPFRLPEQRADRRTKDLAAMARAGFAFNVARKVIDATDPHALDEDS